MMRPNTEQRTPSSPSITADSSPHREVGVGLLSVRTPTSRWGLGQVLARGVLLAGLSLLLIGGAGCGEGNKPADPPAPGKGAVVEDDPAALANGPDQTEQGAGTVQTQAPGTPTDLEPELETETETEIETEIEPDAAPVPAAEPATLITEPAVYWVERHAQRSPFPTPGETINDPIAPTRLTDANPFAPAVDPADIPAIVPWTQAAQYVGHTITVQGVIVRVGKSGKTNFLNFAQDYRGKFYMVLFDDLATTLPDSVQDTFEGKTLRVHGLVEDHRGTPQLKITSMDQVEFVEAE